jgi:hypothetical protein
MRLQLLGFLLLILPSFSLKAETLFDATSSCVKEGGFYTACAAKNQSLAGTVSTQNPLPILRNLPQKWRLGYRFYCSRVSGFGDLEAKLVIDGYKIGLNLSKEPRQQDLTLLLNPGVSPRIEISTSQRHTRLVEDCRFERTSLTVFPISTTVSDVYELVLGKSRTIEFLSGISSSNNESFGRALGYLEGRKSEWSSKLNRSRALIDIYQRRLDNLPASDGNRTSLEAKLAEHEYAVSFFESELANLDLVLANFSVSSLDVFVSHLKQTYQTELAALTDYLGGFTYASLEADLEIIAILCSINPEHPACGR